MHSAAAAAVGKCDQDPSRFVGSKGEATISKSKSPALLQMPITIFSAIDG